MQECMDTTRSCRSQMLGIIAEHNNDSFKSLRSAKLITQCRNTS